MISVKNGSRTLEFEGELLGSSSSYRAGSDRWIEFKIYKTAGDTYILSRVGVSLIYHVAACPLVVRYTLQEESVTDLDRRATPCPDCGPTLEAPMVFPEKYRHWAFVTDVAEAVVDSLHKDDNYGGRYLTKVAQRVLEEAAEKDAELDAAYRVEFIE